MVEIADNSIKDELENEKDHENVSMMEEFGDLL